MIVSIVAALTADGFIARSSHADVDWSSKEDKQFYRELTKRIGVMVMGRSTFDTMGRALPGRRTIVMTSHADDLAERGVEVFGGSPAELMYKLEAEGLDEVSICGGAGIYGAFLAAGLVTDLYLSVQPILFGQGVGLSREPLDVQIELVKSEPLGEGGVLNHYRVVW